MKIEKGVPYSSGWYEGRATAGEVFKEMEVGDSIFVKGCTPQDSPSVLSRYYAKKLGRKYISRTVKGGVRIWRTK